VIGNTCAKAWRWAFPISSGSSRKLQGTTCPFRTCTTLRSLVSTSLWLPYSDVTQQHFTSPGSGLEGPVRSQISECSIEPYTWLYMIPITEFQTNRASDVLPIYPHIGRFSDSEQWTWNPDAWPLILHHRSVEGGVFGNTLSVRRSVSGCHVTIAKSKSEQSRAEQSVVRYLNGQPCKQPRFSVFVLHILLAVRDRRLVRYLHTASHGVVGMDTAASRVAGCLDRVGKGFE
jgi:hypothetical protein